MIKRFMKSRWWHLTAAVTALATVGYVAYMAYTFRVLMVWFLIASVFMTVYEFWKFASFKINAVT
jgi:hypothetical protein